MHLCAGQLAADADILIQSIVLHDMTSVGVVVAEDDPLLLGDLSPHQCAGGQGSRGSRGTGGRQGQQGQQQGWW